MAQWGGRVTPVDDRDRKLFRDILSKEKTVTYGNSWYYLCQAANGIGPDKLGLKYFDGEMLAAIGLYKRETLEDGWHFHIVHPVGCFNPGKILTLAQSMHRLSKRPVYVKKISSAQRDSLINLGFSSIEDYPWHVQAMEEDDTFPEQTIDIAAKLAQLNESSRKDLRDKCQRFTAKFGAHTAAYDLDGAHIREARRLMKQFFRYLEMKNLHISQPSDYDNIIAHPPLGKNGKDYFAQILSIHQKPAALFAIEPIAPETAGLYANIALHQEFPYLSDYLIVSCCRLLQKAGFKFLNLGGSETAGLFQFKEKFSPVAYNKMHWVVYKI
jgi:hypothetical protein